MKKAFTLIELLVVIAIIAILAAILFPVFAQAKLAAKKTQGLAQMKQIGTALQIYAGDYDDGIPTWNNCIAFYPNASNPCGSLLGNQTNYWDAILSPYVKNGRPEASQYAGVWRSPGAEYADTVGRSIGMNQLAMWDISKSISGGLPIDDVTPNVNNGAYYYLNLGEVDTVSQTVYVGDSGRGGRLDPVYFLNTYRDNFITPLTILDWAAPWRYGKDSANYVRMDSSAKSEKGDVMYPHPGRTFGSLSGWPTAVRAQLFCQAARWQAPKENQKQMLRNVALGLGVTCPN